MTGDIRYGWGISDMNIVERSRELAEELFGTLNDSNQIPIVPASTYKLDALSPYSFYYAATSAGPVSWIVVIPTSQDLMKPFLAGDMTEAELFRQTQPRPAYDALYLCSAITLPAYRRRGLATELFRRAIEAIPKTENVQFFAWPYSKEGKKMIRQAERKFLVLIKLPSSSSVASQKL